MNKLDSKIQRWLENNWFIFGYCLLLSALFLLICTKSSPLYPFNDWVDTNASFTMGKAMMNGRVLYRDIFDQRGPLLYFLYGMGYLISHTTFIGIFIFEVLSFATFLFFCYKSFNLYLDKHYSFIVLPLISFLVLNLRSFSHGGSPEEFCLPLLSFSLFCLIRYFSVRYPETMSNKLILINGLIAGCVLWTKYSLLGFWAGWVISIVVSGLVKKHYLQALKSIGLFLAGMLIATVPWIIYFGVNQSIPQWIDSYFVINFVGYAKSMTIFSRLVFIYESFVFYQLFNPLVISLMLLGFILFISLRRFKCSLICKLSLILCFLLLAVTVYGGGQSKLYYFLIFSPFIIFALILVISLFVKDYGSISSGTNFIRIDLIVIILAFLYSAFFNHNAYMLHIAKEDLIQYQYAEIINETENATLLNYGWLDSGLYTTTGIVPNVRFFQNQNISYEKFSLIEDEQNRYIQEKMVDFVLYPVRDDEYKGSIDLPYLTDNYVLIRDDVQHFEEHDFHYLLYKKLD